MIFNAMVESLSSFTFNLKEFIIDEIALEGLEGIGINSLWKRLEARTAMQFSEKLQEKWWNFIINSESISIYKQPVPAQCIEIADRFSIVDKVTGYISEPDFYFDGEFEYNPIDNENGSCAHYKTRVLVTKDLKELPYKTMLATQGNYLVLVASREERWKALAPHLPTSYINLIPQVNYCLLELIGRARDNGQMTTGKTNLTKMVKDSKILFYYRKYLQDLGLIRVSYITQKTGSKTTKSLLLRLKRFHKAIILSLPKSGLICDIVDYLKEKPNYSEPVEYVIREQLMTPLQCKRFQKKADMFQFTNKLVPLGETTNPDVKPKLHKRRYMCLLPNSDESQSEDEEPVPLKCQYKIGVDLMRQGYERFLDAGKNGLTQHELSQILGIEFYIARSICRIFKKKNIVREFFEFRGKQREARFIAIAATSKMEDSLAKEQEKLQKYLEEGKNTSLKRKASSDSEPLSQKKMKKLKNEPADPVLENIVELKEILEDYKKPRSKSKLSLRHIKFQSGIVKVLNEKTFVVGFQTLSTQVAKEINEPPMDTKAMKTFLHNMVREGHIKVFKIKLPHIYNHYSILICAPHVQKSDPIIRAKYKEIESRAQINKVVAKKKISTERPLALYAFPRYVKVQKLHESLMTILYFNEVKSESAYLPRGFFCMESLIPELTIGVALGHISSEGVIDVGKFTIDNSMHDKKVDEAPIELQKALLSSANLNNALRTSLKILSSFGLVQFVAEVADASRIPDNNLRINLFYLNKMAKIIDTSGNWPRETDFEEKEFKFDNLDVVKTFWNMVYNVSINTTIILEGRKKAVYVKSPIHVSNQVEEFDNGTRYGDGRGPCGYDSSYYMDLQRLWRAFCGRSRTMQVKRVKRVQIPVLEKIKKPKIVKRKPVKKAPVKKPKPPVLIETKKPIEDISKKANAMPVWTVEEDRIMMLCKTALTILSPVSQPGCLQVRNLVAKDILAIKDPKKTVWACHRRALVINSNATLTHEKNSILNALRKHNDLLLKYEGLLKKVRIMYPTNIPKCISETRVPMMELVYIMHWLLKHAGRKLDIPCVAMNYNDFHQKFDIVPSSANNCLNIYRTPHSQVALSTLKEAVVLTVMLSFKNEIKKDSAEVIYDYFEQFPELDLRAAVEPIRKCGAIASRDKILNSQMQIVDLNDIAQCSYKISAGYQRRWVSRLSGELGNGLVLLLNQKESEDSIRPGGDTNCFCFEQYSIGALEMVALTVPVIAGPSGSIMQDEQLNVIDIETNYKLKSGKLRWKNKANSSTLGEAYENTQIEIALENLSKRSIIYDNHKPKSLKNNNIVAFLAGKGESGASFEELVEYLKLDEKTLIKNLAKLEAKNYIKRVGFYENVVVHIDFIKNWTMKVKNAVLIPMPWLTLESKVRSEIFFQWGALILNKVFEYPGSSIAFLSEHAEFITARAVQDICDVLLKCKCITMHTLKLKEASLFSEEDNVISEMSDYNEYESPKNIVVLPVLDCLNKFSYIRTMMLNKLQ